MGYPSNWPRPSGAGMRDRDYRRDQDYRLARVMDNMATRAYSPSCPRHGNPRNNQALQRHWVIGNP